jgi:anion-transporting  ArsA/GET3 family ATPase
MAKNQAPQQRRGSATPRLAELLADRRVCVCAGPGGVGKTTASAAIAAGMAARGRKVAVLTIDPAKRLADSLGLPELGNVERRVDPALFAAAGTDLGDGELWAMMLDSKQTFDDVIREHAPDAESRDRILSNRIYQQLSGALAGSQEYMAMEKLYELNASGRYDLLVLDTPPSRNALDFLDAPNRLLQFIDGRALSVFLKPTGIGMRVFGRGASMMFSILRRITGVDLLEDLAEFFQAFGGMVGGFRERARRVNELLADDSTAFLVVCAPQSEPIAEALHFHRKLLDAELPFAGAIVNRVHREADIRDRPAALREELAAIFDGDDDLADRVVANFDDFRELSHADRANIDRFTAELRRSDTVIEVPYLDHDVHDVAGLLEVDRYLFEA